MQMFYVFALQTVSEDEDIKFRCSELNPHLSLWSCSSLNALTFPIYQQQQMLTPSSCMSLTFIRSDPFFINYTLLVCNSHPKCCILAPSMHCLRVCVTLSLMFDPLVWLIVWFCTDLLWYSLLSENKRAARIYELHRGLQWLNKYERRRVHMLKPGAL